MQAPTKVGACIEHSDFDVIESEPHEAVEVADKAMPSQPPGFYDRSQPPQCQPLTLL
jgi:hypothetical protein